MEFQRHFKEQGAKTEQSRATRNRVGMEAKEPAECPPSIESFIRVFSAITLFWDVLFGLLVGLEIIGKFCMPVLTLMIFLGSRVLMSFFWLAIANTAYMFMAEERRLGFRSSLLASPAWYLFVLMMYGALFLVTVNHKEGQDKPWWLIFAVVWLSHMDVICRAGLTLIFRYKMK